MEGQKEKVTKSKHAVPPPSRTWTIVNLSDFVEHARTQNLSSPNLLSKEETTGKREREREMNMNMNKMTGVTELSNLGASTHWVYNLKVWYTTHTYDLGEYNKKKRTKRKEQRV